MGGVSPWRLVAAIGLIVALAGVLVWQLAETRVSDESVSDQVAVNTSAREDSSNEGRWIAAAQAALDAWALFASTGDLAVVDGLIDSDGPQYAQLFGEASTIQPDGGAYSFVMEGPVAAMRDGIPVVSATVMVSLDGEWRSGHSWNMHLVERDGHWLLWTVEER